MLVVRILRYSNALKIDDSCRPEPTNETTTFTNSEQMDLTLGGSNP